MVSKSDQSQLSGVARRKKIRVGFVPLNDAAPLIMAQELGLFQKHGLNVELSRELGWATVRDKILYGELEAAHAVAGMPFALTLGLGSNPCDCVAGMVLSLNGNAITLSESLWNGGVRDAETLRTTGRNMDRPIVFGVVFRYATHNFLLRQWLASGRIDPDNDVQIVVVPPPQMAGNLKAGHIDGFCAGEPWNSVAYASGVGRYVSSSTQLSPGHPDKVLIARRDFAEAVDQHYIQLLAAITEACAFCDHRPNAPVIAQVLTRQEYIGAPKEAILQGLLGQLQRKQNSIGEIDDFIIFSRDNANEPTHQRASWVLQQMRACNFLNHVSESRQKELLHCFRPDLFGQAQKLVSKSSTHEENSHLETTLAS